MPDYAPGTPTQLVKAILAATDGPGTSIEVYFNPKEITVDKPVPWKKHEHVEGNDPTLEFTAAEPKTFACELMFDMFEDRGDVYATYISQLETLTLIDEGLARPSMCTFTWGNAMPVFKGVVEDLNVKYTLFLPDGTPCRATVNLKMKQANSLYNKKEAEEANKKAKEKKEADTSANAGTGGASNSTEAHQAMDSASAQGAPPNSVGQPTPTGGR